MKYRIIGENQIKLSALGFGGASISGEGGGYGFGEISEEESIHLLRHAFESGINLFDSAPLYGFGLSEKRIGLAFRMIREQVVLTSKCGVTWDRQRRPRLDNSPKTTQIMLEQSLRDLQTDMIDIYFVQSPDPNVDIRRTMEVLAKAKQSGKIRMIGLSNTFPEEVTKALEVESIDFLQGEFHLFQRESQKALFPLIQENKMGFLGWGSLDKGILTGRISQDRDVFDQKDVRSQAGWWLAEKHWPKFQALKALKPLMSHHSITGLELALGYVLKHKEVSSALCGFRTHDQIDSALKAFECSIEAELWDEIEQKIQLTIRQDREG